jgi:hypothetical protein
MERLGAVSLLAVLCLSVPAIADEMPARKAGLWEIKTNTGVANMPQVSMKQCIDATTDKMMQNNAGPPGVPKQCTQSNIQKSSNTITIDSTCNIAGRSSTSHMVINGSFDSSYTMTITSQGEGAPAAGRTMTMAATWLGPCAADQRPGDMIMSNGMKMNILDIQKRGAAGMMMAPPGH